MKPDAGSIGQPLPVDDVLLYGCDPLPGLVAVEPAGLDAGGHETVLLYIRSGESTVSRTERFQPWLFAAHDAVEGCPAVVAVESLQGAGVLDRLCRFRCWKDYQSAVAWLAKRTGRTAGAPGAPYYAPNDRVFQYLLMAGRTSFVGMSFDGLRRLQVDIECLTTPGYEFCNAEREGDRIVAIAVGKPDGDIDVLTAGDDEAALIRRWVACVREQDPDVLEGHNLFNFDLPYLAERARRHGVRLELGRDGSVPRRRSSQVTMGERTLSYERFDMHGRHVIDTLFLVHAYDLTHRSLPGFGLKEVARYFGLSDPDRTYVDGAAITSVWQDDPDRLCRYVRDDVRETRQLSALLARSVFLQAQLLPFSYQNVGVRGNAARIDALMIREYVRQRRALPLPDRAREYAGGYTDVLMCGVIRTVHHCDVRSLYPSIMLQERVEPKRDDGHVFLSLLDRLRTVRLAARDRAKRAADPHERIDYDALQATFKVLINSFYGYLGFSQARFNDYDGAERVTARGRAILQGMVESLRANGGTPIEVDTDGIYFVPPTLEPGGLARFRSAITDSLPPGIDLEFDGEYEAMFSYKMKNYALLDRQGILIIKGAALKSRGLEPFQRDFMETVLRLKLEGRDREIEGLYRQYADAIRRREWSIERLARTERLQESPGTYAGKVAGGKRARDAAHELAARSGREYRAGDWVSYYVTGARKRVVVHEAARLISDWNPDRRDENVEFYLDKLDALNRKLVLDGEGEVSKPVVSPPRRKRKASS